MRTLPNRYVSCRQSRRYHVLGHIQKEYLPCLLHLSVNVLRKGSPGSERRVLCGLPGVSVLTLQLKDSGPQSQLFLTDDTTFRSWNTLSGWKALYGCHRFHQFSMVLVNAQLQIKILGLSGIVP